MRQPQAVLYGRRWVSAALTSPTAELTTQTKRTHTLPTFRGLTPFVPVSEFVLNHYTFGRHVEEEK